MRSSALLAKYHFPNNTQDQIKVRGAYPTWLSVLMALFGGMAHFTLCSLQCEACATLLVESRSPSLVHTVSAESCGLR